MRKDLSEAEASEMVKKAIDMAIPGARMFVTKEHCDKVARVLYSSRYKFVYDNAAPITGGGSTDAV